jgi:hypothetical protein
VLPVRRRTIRPSDINCHLDWTWLIALLLLGLCRLLVDTGSKGCTPPTTQLRYSSCQLGPEGDALRCLHDGIARRPSGRIMQPPSFNLFDVSCSALATPFGGLVHAARCPGWTAMSFTCSSSANRSMRGTQATLQSVCCRIAREIRSTTCDKSW